MIGTGDDNLPSPNTGRTEPARGLSSIPFEAEALRLRTRQQSYREQILRHHSLIERLNVASASLIQSLDKGDVYEAIAEIVFNLIRSQEVAIFNYSPSDQSFSLAWSRGVSPEALKPFHAGAGMFGRAVYQGLSQYGHRQPTSALLPYESNLTACVVLKSSRETVGVIAIFDLLPEKLSLDWVDFELLKFLEIYGAAAIQFQQLQDKQPTP